MKRGDWYCYDWGYEEIYEPGKYLKWIVMKLGKNGLEEHTSFRTRREAREFIKDQETGRNR